MCRRFLATVAAAIALVVAGGVAGCGASGGTVSPEAAGVNVPAQLPTLATNGSNAEQYMQGIFAVAAKYTLGDFHPFPALRAITDHAACNDGSREWPIGDQSGGTLAVAACKIGDETVIAYAPTMLAPQQDREAPEVWLLGLFATYKNYLAMLKPELGNGVREYCVLGQIVGGVRRANYISDGVGLDTGEGLPVGGFNAYKKGRDTGKCS